jgi:hypothetical protein
MSRIHWVVRGTGTPKDRDEVNTRVVYECDGSVCDTLFSVLLFSTNRQSES